MSTSFPKRFGRAAARYGMYSFYWLFKVFPYWLVKGIAGIIIPIAFSLTLKHRKVASESLQVAFGQEKSEEDRKRIVHQCFSHAGKNMVEMMYYLSHPEKTEGKIFFEGRQYLDEALSKGKGVIAVTAHFGNFPLMMLYCAKAGYKVSSIIRPARDEKLEEFLLKERKKAHLNTVYAIPRNQCVSESLRVLRNGEILFVPLDQNFGDRGGVFVDFFGQKAATATGPIIYAKRTEAPVLLMFIVRLNDDCHKIFIEPAIALEEKENDEATVIYNTQRITNIIEKYIRRYPHEWGWMHRRWKSQPSVNHKQFSERKNL